MDLCLDLGPFFIVGFKYVEITLPRVFVDYNSKNSIKVCYIKIKR